MPRLPDPSSPSPGGVPVPLIAAAGLTVVEGLLTIGFGISEAVSLSSHRLVMGLTTAVFFLLYGAGLLVCAWAMRNLRPWSRSPVLLAQLIFLGLAWNLRHGALPAAIAAAVLAVLVLAGVFHPRSLDALNREEHRHHDHDPAEHSDDSPDGPTQR
ncbi:MAG: hypothetical protein ACRDPH_14530 [Marmoricola sp.]